MFFMEMWEEGRFFVCFVRGRLLPMKKHMENTRFSGKRCIFADEKSRIMTTAVLERETNNYWELIKNLSAEVKLALIARLSASLVREAVQEKSDANSLIDEILQNAPINAPLTDEEIQQEVNAVRYAV